MVIKSSPCKSPSPRLPPSRICTKIRCSRKFSVYSRGRRCAIREPPDYSHSPKVKNCRNPDYRKMNGPRRTACFAKGMPNYIFFTLDSTWFDYTDLLTADSPVSRSCQTRHERTNERTNERTDNVQIFVLLQLLMSLCETRAFARQSRDRNSVNYWGFG